MLPIHPTSAGDSPFQGPSVFAGNPNLISLEQLVKKGDLSQEEYEQYLAKWEEAKSSGANDGSVDYGFLWNNKLGFDSRNEGYENAALRQAYKRFKQRIAGYEKRKDPDKERKAPPTGRKFPRKEKYDRFCKNNKDWLDDYAVFMALKEKNGFENQWYDWDIDERMKRVDQRMWSKSMSGIQVRSFFKSMNIPITNPKQLPTRSSFDVFITGRPFEIPIRLPIAKVGKK